MGQERERVKIICGDDEQEAVQCLMASLHEVERDKAIVLFLESLPRITSKFAEQLCLIYLGYLGCSDVMDRLAQQTDSPFPLSIGVVVALANLGQELAEEKMVSMLERGDDTTRREIFECALNCSRFSHLKSASALELHFQGQKHKKGSGANGTADDL